MDKKINYFALAMLFSIVLFFSGCENDDSFDKKEMLSLNAESRYITYEEMSKNSLAFNEFKKVESKVKSAKNERLLYNSLYNFTIDTDKILYIEKGEYKSFTFPIYRDVNTDETENFIISIKNGEINSYTSKYTLTELEKEKIENNEYVDLASKVEFNNLENQTNTSGGCWTLINIPLEWNEQGQVTASFVLAVEIDCPEDGSGSSDSGGTDNGNTDWSSWWTSFWGSWAYWGYPSGNNPVGDTPGGGTGDGTYNPGDNQSGTENPNPDDPLSISIYDGDPIITYPVLDDKANIKDLNKLTNLKSDGTETNIKIRIDQLKNNLSTSLKENGYMFDSDQNTLPSYNQGPNFTNFANSGLPQYYISLHMHQDYYIPKDSTTPIPTNVAPSDKDVLNLLLLHDQTDNKNVTSIIVSRKGTYAMRVNNRQMANNAFDAFQDTDNGSKVFKDFVDEYDDKVMTPYLASPLNDNDVMNGFITFINTHLINGMPMGIAIYQAIYDNQGNIINWVKL